MLLLRSANRWVFFGALFFGPWAYGGTTAWSIRILDWLLGATVVLWMVEVLIGRRRIQVPAFLLFLVAALLVIGCWMVVNAGAIMETTFSVFVPLPKPWPNAPGSIDYAISADWMIRAALLLGTILYVADFSRDDYSFLQVSEVIALVGGSIALLGLLEKATGAPMIFWQAHFPPLKTFFGTFYYHANAGAFLNLVWPLTAGLALRAFIAPSHPNARGLWIAVFVLTLVSVAANTSRMAQLT